MSRIGLGHQNQIATLPYDSTRKGLVLRNGRWTRQLDPAELAGWAEIWLGFGFYVQNEFLWDGAIAAGGIEYGNNLIFSFGLSNGSAGSLPARDVYGTQSYWIGRRSSVSGSSVFGLRRDAAAYTTGDYFSYGFIPRSVKNGAVSSSATATAAFRLNNPVCFIQRFRLTGGNIVLSNWLISPQGRACTVYEMMDILNIADVWTTCSTRATTRYSWTDISTGHTIADEQATYGTLNSIDIGWWQNQMPFYLDTVLTKII